MLNPFITILCGITLQTQVNACRVTLEQVMSDYNQVINTKVEKLKREFEAELPQYTKYSIVAAKAVYERRVVLTSGPLNVNLKQNEATCTLRWTF